MHGSKNQQFTLFKKKKKIIRNEIRAFVQYLILQCFQLKGGQKIS